MSWHLHAATAAVTAQTSFNFCVEGRWFEAFGMMLFAVMHTIAAVTWRS